MRTKAKSSFIAASILPWVASAASSITSFAPEQFMGWESKLDSWNPITCDPGQTYTTSDGFVRCCSDVKKNCAFVTRCASNVMSLTDGSRECGSGQTCVTMTIYETLSPNAPYVRDLFCWNGWTAFTIFQKTPATAPSTVTTSSLSTLPSPTPNSLTSLTSATSTSSPLTLTTPRPEKVPQESDEYNKSWIAGAVVGPIAGCALIGALGFCIGRRRKRNTSEELVDDNKPAPRQELSGGDVPVVAEMDGTASRPKPLRPYYREAPSGNHTD